MNGSTREDAILTTKGINEAIKYASENNINYIKLEKGTYLIDVVDNEITLMSNIELDLNGSTLKVLSNSEPRYNLMHIIDAQNVKVKNGILLGDRETHDYTNQAPSTHEWGHGIKIENAKDIEISNLEISLMIGDGIDINDTMGENKMRTENIVITRNNIHHVRRNGISVGAVDTLEITYNSIHDISGTNPQSGIDIERNNANQFYKNVTISNNKIYNHKNGSSIAFFDTAENFKIIDNELSDRITASRYSRRDRNDTFPYFPIEDIMEQYNITISGNKVIDESLLDKETYTATATEENVNVLNMRTSQVFVTGVTINKTTLELEEGDTETLTATTIPTNADYRAVTWSSSNKNVATITVDSGKITAKGPGTTIITVTTKDGEKTATCEVTVTEKTVQGIPVSEISLNKQQMELEEGKEETLIATVFPKDATNKNILWSSADEKIAKVENGIVTGISKGITTIIVSIVDEKYIAECEVTVLEKKQEEKQNQEQKEEQQQQQQEDSKDQENKQQEQNSQTSSSDNNFKQDDIINNTNNTNSENNDGISNNKDVKNENKTTYLNKNTKNSSITTSTAINGKETTAKTTLPKTGSNEKLIIFSILIALILSITFGIKIKKYKGI